MVVPNHQEIRPFQVSANERQFENLLAIAIQLGVQVSRSSVPGRLGRSTIVGQLIRDIADGKLVVGYPDQPEPPGFELGG